MFREAREEDGSQQVSEVVSPEHVHGKQQVSVIISLSLFKGSKRSVQLSSFNLFRGAREEDGSKQISVVSPPPPPLFEVLLSCRVLMPSTLFKHSLHCLLS